MAYPTVDQSYKSTRKAVAANKIDYAVNGTPRALNFHTNTTYNFTVIHEMTTSTEMQSIVDCYTSVMSDSVSLVWDADNDAYTCIFKGEPDTVPIPGGLWNVTSKLAGQKT